VNIDKEIEIALKHKNYADIFIAARHKPKAAKTVGKIRKKKKQIENIFHQHPSLRQEYRYKKGKISTIT